MPEELSKAAVQDDPPPSMERYHLTGGGWPVETAISLSISSIRRRMLLEVRIESSSGKYPLLSLLLIGVCEGSSEGVIQACGITWLDWHRSACRSRTYAHVHLQVRKRPDNNRSWACTRTVMGHDSQRRDRDGSMLEIAVR